MRSERILVAGRELVIKRPDDPEGLIDEARFDEDEFLPYWAELWPSGIALAELVAELDLQDRRVLEVGCGLALPSFAAALAGGDVLATDWAREAVDLVALNARENGLALTSVVLDWGSARVGEIGQFDLVLAADVLYEERNAAPLLRVLEVTVAQGGEALIADPGRRHAAAFFELAQAAGWLIERVGSGTIGLLRRDGTRETG